VKKSFFCLISVLMTALALLAFASTASAREYTLEEIYQEALRNSDIIKVARENLYVSQLGKDKARSLLIPRVTAFGSYNRFSERKFTDTSIMIQPDETSTWGVRADQSFSMSARELDAYKIAGQSITKSEYELETIKEDFVLAVASSYFDVLRARKALDIAAANFFRLIQYRESVEKRVKVGELTRTSLLRAEGELSGARSDYVKAENAVKLSRAALIRLTGVEEDFTLSESLSGLDEDASIEEMMNVALQSRPDLKSYDMQVQISEKQIKYARGAFWPNVNLFALYQGMNQSPASLTLNRESTLAGVALNFPFFEGGLRVAELKEAEARKRQSQLLYDDLIKNVDIELKSAYLDLQTQKSVVSFLEAQLDFARDNYKAVLRQFENELATSLDVMDANTLLVTAERNLSEASYSYQLACLKVKNSKGTLLQFITAGHSK
jgi:outer membrane protein